MISKFIKSVGFALNGIYAAAAGQRNLKIQIVIAVFVIGFSAYLDISQADWVVVLLTVGLVIALEMINTAIESLVDLVTPAYNPVAGKVKDIAAGAVLVVSLFAAVIGCIVFLKYV